MRPSARMTLQGTKEIATPSLRRAKSPIANCQSLGTLPGLGTQPCQPGSCTGECGDAIAEGSFQHMSSLRTTTQLG